MIKILLFLLAFYSAEVFAGCPQPQSNHVVVTIEGLMGRAFGSRARSMARAVNTSGYDIADFSHRDSVPRMVQCIQQWRSQRGFRVSIVGHSMGGPVANNLARALGERGIRVSEMMLFDSRYGSDPLNGGNRCNANQSFGSFRRPSNVGRIISIHQCGFLSGRHYTGGNVENYGLSGVRHIDLPQSGFSQRLARELFNSGGSASRVPIVFASAEPRERPRSTHPERGEGGRTSICVPQMGRSYPCTYEEATRINGGYGETISF